MNLRPVTRCELREHRECHNCHNCHKDFKLLGMMLDHDTGKYWCAGCALQHQRKETAHIYQLKPQLVYTMPEVAHVVARVNVGTGLPVRSIRIPRTVASQGREAISGFITATVGHARWVALEYGDETDEVY